MTKTNTVATAAPKKARRGASLDNRKSRAGWIFVLPFVIGFIVIYLPIVIDSIKYSFNKINILQGGGYSLTFVGWDNYQEALFVDPSYVRTLTAGIQQLVFDIPAIVIFSLFMAVLLNQKMFGRAAFRAIFFVPVILSTGLIASIDQGNQLLEYMRTQALRSKRVPGNDSVTEIVSLTDIGWLFDTMKFGTDLVET